MVNLADRQFNKDQEFLLNSALKNKIPQGLKQKNLVLGLVSHSWYLCLNARLSQSYRTELSNPRLIYTNLHLQLHIYLQFDLDS